jgi:hypothetical protein
MRADSGAANGKRRRSNSADALDRITERSHAGQNLLDVRSTARLHDHLDLREFD